MPEVHAILSASSSKRWLNCTPSARLEQNFPNESSVYAEEGTAAHALGEYKLRKYLHERVKRPTSEYEDEEMEANTDIYAEFIISTVERIKETCPHPLVMVEERLDYSYLVPQGFGTGDCVIIADGMLYVMDYKNGKGVFVNCDHAFNDRLVIDNPEAQPTPVTYTVRRLTPTECARLQGFPDWWCRDLGTENPTEEELAFWADVFETHRKIVTHAKKPKTEKQIRKWLADPYTDSAEYRIWGNGICLANAFFVLAGIAWCAGLEE